MAAGKSSVGKRLAQLMDLPFVDLDREIEAMHGSIPDLFARGGDALFRQLEHETLISVLARAPAVIALGGGTSTFEPSVAPLKARCYRVFLDVPFAVLFRRLQRARHARPALGRGPQAQQIAQLYERRLPLYQSADLRVVVTSEAPDTIAQRIFSALPSPVS
ncbi:MAG: shikimate kinase [Vulcanimicrobiaceae bacterium]